MRNIAVAYMRMGQYLEAMEYLKQARAGGSLRMLHIQEKSELPRVDFFKNF